MSTSHIQFLTDKTEHVTINPPPLLSTHTMLLHTQDTVVLPHCNGWLKEAVPLVLSSLATAFCSATFQMMRRLSALALANTSALCGHQEMAVMVFLCSDMMERNLNSLYLWSSCKREQRKNVLVMWIHGDAVSEHISLSSIQCPTLCSAFFTF